MFHKIKKLIKLDDYILLVGFADGEWRSFDLKPLMKKYPQFSLLKENNLYKQGKIDLGGFGIVWNDELDISAEGIYEQGKKAGESYSLELMDIAEYIKTIRTTNYLSQKDLSHLSGVSQSTIARIENKDIDPSVGTINRLLAPFGKSLSIK